MSFQLGFPRASRHYTSSVRCIRPTFWERVRFRGHEILWEGKEVKNARLAQSSAVDGNRHLHK